MGTSQPAAPFPRPGARQPGQRQQNRRGQGARLQEEIITAAARLLNDLGHDAALSMRAVARAIGVAPTSVYIHFPDRDALVLAVMARCHADLLAAIGQAEESAGDPAEALRRRTRIHAEWARSHPGLYKVLHESTVNQRAETPLKNDMAQRTAAAISRCIDAGLAPPGDPAIIASDLRTAIHGLVSLQINQPQTHRSDASEQIDRFLAKLVGIPPASAKPNQ
jgi:AcrR family transcriptional regulator